MNESDREKQKTFNSQIDVKYHSHASVYPEFLHRVPIILSIDLSQNEDTVAWNGQYLEFTNRQEIFTEGTNPT